MSAKEVSEVNRVLGGNLVNGQWFVRANSEPAKIYAWNKLPLALSTILGLGLGAFPLNTLV